MCAGNAPNANDSSAVDGLILVVDALERRGIPYVVGSFASTYWGRPRTTHDADLVVDITPVVGRTGRA